VEILGDVDAPRLAVISFLLRSQNGLLIHPRLVVRLLNDVFGIQARGGCACAGPYGHRLLDIGTDLSERFLDVIDAGHEGLKPGWTRISLHYTLTNAEVDFIVDAVLWLAENGHRFIGPYAIDWVTGAWAPRVTVASTLISTAEGPVTPSAHIDSFRLLFESAVQVAKSPGLVAAATSGTETSATTTGCADRLAIDIGIANSWLDSGDTTLWPAITPPNEVPADLVYFRVSR
jgi:hypothetical protein